jgi:hypothetical protein
MLVRIQNFSDKEEFGRPPWRRDFSEWTHLYKVETDILKLLTIEKLVKNPQNEKSRN